jgi:hypothetical protein
MALQKLKIEAQELSVIAAKAGYSMINEQILRLGVAMFVLPHTTVHF